MKHSILMVMILSVLAIASLYLVQAAGRDNMASVRNATAQFQTTAKARAAGYDSMTGLDNCFQNYGVGGKGYHYINASSVDTTVDLLHPEALIYAPDATGSIELAAVAYIVPAPAWDAEHHELPRVLGQNLHAYERLDAYVLYVWIWKTNPSGMFEDWNPDVTCPAPSNWSPPIPGRWR